MIVNNSFSTNLIGKKMKIKKKHPGFKKIASGIAKKEGISKERANAILASASRKASPAAKKANPKLKKVSKKK